MTYKKIHAEYEHYKVHVTKAFEQSLIEVHNKFLEKETRFRDDETYIGSSLPDGFADEWLDKVTKYIQNLRNPDIGVLGTIDSKHYSSSYVYKEIPDTETTIFMLIEKNQIYIVYSGWSRADWPNEMQKFESQILKGIKDIKDKFAQEK